MKTPRILFIQTPRIWLSLLCTSAMLLTACGGGGGGSNGAAPANTTPTRITVIDGYLQGAVVCVDKNNNSACDPGETQGSTDASGRVVLNIPKADVGKYPIVAAVPASAVDSDQPGKTVGKAYTLKAPKDSPNNVTPLTTLVQHMVETDSSSTEEATTFVVNQTGVQQPLDDFIHRGDSQTRTLARTLAALLQDRLNALSDNSISGALSPADASRVTTSEKHKAVVKALWNAMADIKSRSQLAANSACASAPQSDACQTAINQAVSASLSANDGLGTRQLLSSLQTQVAAPSYSSQSNNLIAAAVNTPQAPGFSNPSAGDEIAFSVRNLPVGTQSVTWNFSTDNDATPTNATKTVDLANNSLEKATASYSTPGKKTVTVTFKSINNAVIATDTLNITIGNDNSLPTVRITGVVSNSQYIASGNKTDSNTVLVRGSYSGTLGDGYSIKVYDGSTYLGDARDNPKNNTWTYNASNLSLSPHSFKAAVVKNGDAADKGTDSNVYSVSVGNLVTASNNSPNMWDEFKLMLSNVWATVTKVVFSVLDSDKNLAKDPEANYTASQSGDTWSSVFMAFKTTGWKTITAEFFGNENGTEKLVDTSTVQVKVGEASVVTQTAAITDVKDGDESIPDTGTTTNTKPTISGTVYPALGKYYNVKVYDGDSQLPVQLPGTVTYDNARTSWTFTPDPLLSGRLYKLTAKVATFDAGATGLASAIRTVTVRRNLNDTGIGGNQCYKAGNSTLISCTDPEAIGLNSQQDGMVGRDFGNSDDSDGKLGFSFSEVPSAVGGNYARTDCVKDNITGLMWEGKPDTGLRGGLNPNSTYTNFDTGDQINAITNAQGYVNAVNAAGLCGYTDWRLPTVSELQSIVDYGVASQGPTIDGNWFPSTQGNWYWSSSPYVGNSSLAWLVSFGNGYVGNGNRYYGYYYVRLVR
jgi:hypothetical protein